MVDAMKNWKAELTAGEKNSRSKYLERYLPGKLAFAITIFNSNDAIQLRT